jgi:hypothetical protein
MQPGQIKQYEQVNGSLSDGVTESGFIIGQTHAVAQLN